MASYHSKVTFVKKEHKTLMDDLDKLAQVKICQVAHSNEA